MDTVPEDRMPEAEVALRFAIWLLSFPDAAPSTEVGIDGSAARVFPVWAFLREEGWHCSESGGRDGTCHYQGIYTEGARTLRVHARPGVSCLFAFGHCSGFASSTKMALPLMKHSMSASSPAILGPLDRGRSATDHRIGRLIEHPAKPSIPPTGKRTRGKLPACVRRSPSGAGPRESFFRSLRARCLS